MKVILGLVFIIVHFTGYTSFIIPDELPSILSVIYSNIPTLKKGTDSRIGWGFRLGDRADFQILVEMGPQTNTQPLANQGDGNTNKRNTLNNLADTLYAQRQQEKKYQEKKEKSSDSEAGKWLKSWSKTVSSKEQENEGPPLKPKPGIAIGEIDAKSVFPDDYSVLKQTERPKPARPKKQVKKNPKNSNKSLVSILTENDGISTKPPL